MCTRVGDDYSPLGTAEFAESVSLDLPQLLLQAAANGRPGPKHAVSSAKRMQILRRAEDYIDQRASEPLTVREVCEAVQTSVRTLQLAFAERYGISPKAYIRAIRLNRARRLFRIAEPRERNVADIANECGFWHMGQFAADYQRHFGELPSATFRDKRRTRSRSE